MTRTSPLRSKNEMKDGVEEEEPTTCKDLLIHAHSNMRMLVSPRTPLEDSGHHYEQDGGTTSKMAAEWILWRRARMLIAMRNNTNDNRLGRPVVH